MNGVPEAGGAYERQPDGTLKRVERTIGPNEAPAPEAAAPAARPKSRSVPADAGQATEES